jgi:hypothetical protein
MCPHFELGCAQFLAVLFCPHFRFSWSKCEAYWLLQCDAVQSCRCLPIFRVTCSFHLEGRRVREAWKKYRYVERGASLLSGLLPHSAYFSTIITEGACSPKILLSVNQTTSCHNHRRWYSSYLPWEPQISHGLNVFCNRDGILIQLSRFWTLSIVLFLFKTTFWWLDSVPVFRWNLLSWAQSIDLVPVTGVSTGNTAVMDL